MVDETELALLLLLLLLALLDQLISLVLIIHHMNQSLIVLLDDALFVKVLDQPLVGFQFLFLLLECYIISLELLESLQLPLNLLLPGLGHPLLFLDLRLRSSALRTCLHQGCCFSWGSCMSTRYG